MKWFIWGLVLCLGVLTVGDSQAGTIDLLKLPGNVRQSSWGNYGATDLYAQSIVATDSVLDQVTFQASMDVGNPSLKFNVLITGSRLDNVDGAGLGLAPSLADIRYNSGMRSLTQRYTMTDVTINPSLRVTTGETLFLVLDAFSYKVHFGSYGSVMTTGFGGTERYPPGEFVFIPTDGLTVHTLQDVDAFPWNHRGEYAQDIAFRASFSSVPEPSTLALFVASAFGLLVWAWCRRKGA